MELKSFLLCFAFFVVTVSGASLIDLYEFEADEPKKETVSKYKLEVDDGNKKVDETIEIDTEKEIETFHIPSDGDTSSSSPGDVDVVYDFKRNMVMQRMSNQKACFLSNSTDSPPKPSELQKILDRADSLGLSQSKPTKKTDDVVVGTLTDRSILSDEMIDMCKKFPIYLVKEESVLEDAEKREHLQRKRRGGYCRYITFRYCYAPGCCTYKCLWYCPYSNYCGSYYGSYYGSYGPTTSM